MATEEIKYVIPSDGQGDAGSQVDLVVTYDSTQTNNDGSYTVTGASGSYKTLDANGNILNSDTITGISAVNSIGGNDNELFISSDPNTSAIVTDSGIAFTISNAADSNDGAGNVNFYSNAPGNAFEYFENGNNYSAANSVTESPACYAIGTLIRALRGGAEVDVAVESLAIGDEVVTASGARRPVKWIGHRHYAARFVRNNPALLPIRFRAGSIADGVPARDLRVSPKHAMAFDGVLIPAERLVNGVTVVREQEPADLSYWHVELDSHDVLLAEGAASESFVDDGNRGIFHNAASFDALYPQEHPHAARRKAAYCAPRLESGHAVQAVRRRLAERAGLPAAPRQAFGALFGHVDECRNDGHGGTMVRGWAWDALHADAPVCLDVVVDGAVAAMVYADAYRSDLAATGSGRHGFEVTLPLAAAQVVVRRSADGAVLPGGATAAISVAQAA